MRKITPILIVAITLILNISALASNPEPSPYGACAHLVGHEFEGHEQTMRMMQAAGIKWVRADFSWSILQPKPDLWQFERCDAIVANAKKYNIQILPILDYNNKFANPAWQHLDKWDTYVHKTVERYQDSIPVWEVWNEQNLEGFWHDPNPTNYLALLKKTYATIKSINPELKVAVGGYAGIPFDYIETIYKLGGGGCFDIMNVHPYSHPRPPELYLEGALTQLHAIMDKYGDSDKPIWITEIGWPTHTPEQTPEGVLLTALKTVLPPKAMYRVICLKDPDSDIPGWLTKERMAAKLPTNSSVQVLDYDAAIATLDSYEIDVLVMPLSENYYVDDLDRIARYVEEGGTVVSLHGMPLWYGYTKNSDGEWRKINKVGYNKLRVQTEAWWNKKGVIPEEMEVQLVGPAADIDAGGDKFIAKRFILPYNFKEGDRFIPLLQGKTDQYTGTAAAIYDFNSDWKGAVIVSTMRQDGAQVVDEDGQARILPRAHLIARRNGVDRLFWYEFQAPENILSDQESHFGIIHKDFSEKPAYSSYRTLTSQFPAGSTFIEKEWRRSDGSLYYPQWRSPDGSSAGAIWSFKAPGAYRVNFNGTTPTFTAYDGEPFIPPFSNSSATVCIDDAPLYFHGAEITTIELESNMELGLKAALPQAFNRAEFQYSALLQDMQGTKNLQPRCWQNNKLIKVGPEDWTNGFFPAALWYLYEYTGADKWRNAAKRSTAIQTQLRDYCGNPVNRKARDYCTGQGASSDTSWACGQSWVLYGCTMMHRESGKKEYLESAIKCADTLVNHPNLPQDKIPYWNYQAAEIPHAPRDVAAASIMASALLELSTFESVPDAAKYRSVAIQQLLSLSSPAYLAPAGKNGNFILMHAVGDLPGKIEIDVPLIYADYYYLEALLRFKKTM